MHGYPPESWQSLFRSLEIWNLFSLEQRRHALKVQAVFQDLPIALESLPEPLRDRCFDMDAKGRYRPQPEFRKLLALLNRLASWSKDVGPDLLAYIKGMTTHAQRMALTGSGYIDPDIMAAAMERRMISGWFTRSLIDKPDATGFLKAMGGWTPEGLEYTGPRHDALRGWVQGHLKGKRTGFALGENIFKTPGHQIPPQELLALLLAYGIVFIGLYPSSLEPVLQIMLPLESRPQSLDNLDLRFHQATETFQRPFLIDDIDAMLWAVKTDPAPLLSDGYSLPMAQLRKLGKTFAPLPAWLPEEGFLGEHRAMAAWWMIAQMGLTTAQGRGRKTQKAHLNPVGQDWMSLPPEKKLARLLEEAPVGRRSEHRLGDWFSWLGDDFVHPFPFSAMNGGILAWMDGAVARLLKPADMAAWLESAALKANPLIADRERDPVLDARWSRWDTLPAAVYGRLLGHHLARLASLGALELSRDKEGNVGVTLSGAGLWLYGFAEAWSQAKAARPIAVIGADFTVTLLEPAPDLALELAAFSEPSDAATAFRITRLSVQEAAHRGLHASDILRVLREWSKHALPANVVYEIEAWARSRAALRLSEAILLEGDDPVAMAEILSGFPKDFEQVSPTVLKAKAGSKRTTIMKRLGKKGFFPC